MLRDFIVAGIGAVVLVLVVLVVRNGTIVLQTLGVIGSDAVTLFNNGSKPVAKTAPAKTA